MTSDAPRRRGSADPWSGATGNDMSPAEEEAWSRHQARRSRQRRWLRSRGIPGVPSEGRPNRPGNHPDALRANRRRYRMRKLAEALGVTVEEAERIILLPRERDARGRLLPRAVASPPGSPATAAQPVAPALSIDGEPDEGGG